jgi:hypothetical protein
LRLSCESLSGGARGAYHLRVTHACALAWVLLTGCLYDEGERCGPSRELQRGLCVCQAGLMEQGGECVAPPEVPAGLGDACDVMTKACTGATYTVCHVTMGTAGYCTTSACDTDADCEGGFYCEKDEGPSYCRRPPTGQGMACSSNADCDGMEASFCTVGAPFGMTCTVPDCTDTSCSPGRTCMDLSAFVPGIPKLCVP